MTAEVESIQGLLWKYKRGTVTNSWKRNWVYADNEHFFQWAGKNRPQRDEVPKYELFIPNCNLTRSDLKKFSFSIQLQPGGEAMVFATDDQHSFQKWWKLLHKHCSRASSSSSAADDTHSDDNTLNTEEQKNLALNVLRRNRRKSQGDNTSIGTFSETASQEEEQVMQLFRKISKRNVSHSLIYVSPCQCADVVVGVRVEARMSLCESTRHAERVERVRQSRGREQSLAPAEGVRHELQRR